MVQIARRKKGRPSKADLARRSGESPAAASQPDLRRSHRRRSVRYNIIDYDGDYLDDEEDERRREKKKLKLMAKLNQDGEEEPEEENDMTPSRTAPDAPAEEYEDDENEQDEEHEHEQEEEHVEDEDGVVMHYSLKLRLRFCCHLWCYWKLRISGHEYIVNANNLDVSAELVC